MLPGPDGHLRCTGLSDAKHLGLLPGVSSILSTLAKPALETWKQRQAILAAERTVRAAGENDDSYAARVMAAALRPTQQAANLGTRIHNALEACLAGNPFPSDLATYVTPVIDWKTVKKLTFVEREKTVVNHAHGFAGTLDAAIRFGHDGIGIIDFKTRKTRPGHAVTAYDGQPMQIAAYAATYWGEEALSRVYGANVFISTTESGRMEVQTYHPNQLLAEWNIFKMACAIWRHVTSYDPRKSMKPVQVAA